MDLCEERVFVKLVYLAAAKLQQKQGWVEKKDMHLYKKEQGLKDIYECLGKNYCKILEKSKDKAIRLNIDSDNIILDRSLKNFVSTHWRGLVQRVEYLKGILDKESQQDEIISFLLNHNHQSAIRNTVFVKEALEKINRRFQSIQWRRLWHKLLQDIKDMIDIIVKSRLDASLKEDDNFQNILNIINSELKESI